MSEPCLQIGAGGAVSVTVTRPGPDPASDREALHRFAAHVAAVDGAALRSGRRCGWCGATDHGRPWATTGDRTIGVGLARTPGVLALVAGAGSVGVDVERVTRVVRAPLDAFTAGERDRAGDDQRALTACWAVKEAVLKRDGRGLRVDPATVDVTLDGGRATVRGTADASLVLVRWLDDDVVLAVAVDPGVVVDFGRVTAPR